MSASGDWQPRLRQQQKTALAQASLRAKGKAMYHQRLFPIRCCSPPFLSCAPTTLFLRYAECFLAEPAGSVVLGTGRTWNLHDVVPFCTGCWLLFSCLAIGDCCAVTEVWISGATASPALTECILFGACWSSWSLIGILSSLMQYGGSSLHAVAVCPVQEDSSLVDIQYNLDDKLLL